MQVSFQPAVKTQNQPSFGMAKLTKKGQAAAKHFVGKLPQFVDDSVYTRKNLLKRILKGKTGEVTPQKIADFFEYSDTQFADKNAQFIKKQILPLTGRAKIKSFLADEHLKAVKVLRENNQKVSSADTTEAGMALIDSIRNAFDLNINNPQVSAKKGKQMLDLIKDFLGTEEHIQRAAVVSDKLYAKK